MRKRSDREVQKAKHIRGFFRRMVAALLTAIVLTFTVAGDCIIPPVPVQATGAEIEALLAIIEAVMASMGLSFSSTADLNSAASALQYGMDNDYQYAVQGTDMFSGLKEGLQTALNPPQIDPDAPLVNPEAVVLPAAVYAALQSWLYNYAAGNISEGVDVLNPAANGKIWETSFPGINVKSVSGFSRDALFYGQTIKRYRDEDALLDVDMEKVNDFPIVVSTIRPDSINIQYASISRYEQSKGFFVYNLIDGCFELYGRNGEKISSCEGRAGFQYYASNNSYWFGSDKPFPDYDETSYRSHSIYMRLYSDIYQITVYVKPGVEVYSSVAQGKMMNNLSVIGGLSSKVYGLSSSAGSKSITKNDDGTVTFKNLQVGITKAVEMSVANALAANPAITDAELNAVAAQVIASNEQIKDEISSEITEQTGVLAGLLTSIQTVANANSLGIAGLQTDITALQESVDALAISGGEGVLDWPDELIGVGEAFGEVTGQVDAGDSDNDSTGPPLVWVPDMYKVPEFLRGLLEYFTKPLLIITRSMRAIWDLINGLVRGLSDTFQEWVEPLVNGLVGGLGIPGVIDVNPGAAFREWLEGLFGDIAIPGTMDVPGVGEIEDILTDALVIDTAAIADAAGGLEDVWTDVFPVDDITDALESFHFSDSYSYPVIKMQTPDNLKRYYNSEYIVFLDFGGDMFRKYCLWVRGLARAFIWFKFSLQVIKMFKVNFHVA